MSRVFTKSFKNAKVFFADKTVKKSGHNKIGGENKMKDRFNEYYPSEHSFLTNPIASHTEATGCALRIEKRDERTMSLSAPVKGTKLPGKNEKELPKT